MPNAKDQGQAARLTETLKSLFRAHGLRHADIAAALDISRTTLKRRLAGNGLTIDLLEQLCALVDVTMNELFELAAVDNDKKLKRQPWTRRMRCMPMSGSASSSPACARAGRRRRFSANAGSPRRLWSAISSNWKSLG